MFIKNPIPILKQRKSEMNTNPLIVGEETNTVTYIKKKRRPILLDTNVEFTETIERMTSELYENGRIKMTRKKLKWLVIIFIVIILYYILVTVYIGKK